MSGMALVVGCAMAVLMAAVGRLWIVRRREIRAREVEQRLREAGRMRVVAFNPRGKDPTGYYAIERFDGWAWVHLCEWCQIYKRWLPVLRHYEEAKRLATDWKDPDRFQAWVDEQKQSAEKWRMVVSERRRELYPVRIEEV